MIRHALQIALLLLPLALSAVTVREYLGFDPEKEGDLAANAYIAQENVILFRMRYPNGSYREFERNFVRPDVLVGGGGWKGRITSADEVVVRTGRDPNGVRWEWKFKSGRCVSFGKVKGTKRTFAYDAPRAAPGISRRAGSVWSSCCGWRSWGRTRRRSIRVPERRGNPW